MLGMFFFAAAASTFSITGILPLVIVVFASITAPMFLNTLNTRNAAKERERQWAREDAKDKIAKQEREADIARQEAVAKKAQEAADLLATATAQADQKAEEAREALLASNAEVARIASASAQSVDAQLVSIHRLVNSNLITVMERELANTVQLVDAMGELMAVNRRAGFEPTPESSELLKDTLTRVSVLSKDIVDRKKLSESADAQVAAHPAATPQPETE